MVERLDEEKLETLRGWGAGLVEGARDELRAAGKAILILIDEIERLQVDLWHARSAAMRPPGTDTGAHAPPAASSQSLASTLHRRLHSPSPESASREGEQ